MKWKSAIDKKGEQLQQGWIQIKLITIQNHFHCTNMITINKQILNKKDDIKQMYKPY